MERRKSLASIVSVAALISLTMTGNAFSGTQQIPNRSDHCDTRPCKPQEPVESADSSRPTTKRLSLNPYGSQLDHGASFILSGYDAPIILPENGFPKFHHGFTIPDDYQGGPLILELLVESEATSCDFHMRQTALFRMGVGEPHDWGGASDGLSPLDASDVLYSLPLGNGIVFTAPATPKESVQVRFKISDEGFSRPFEPGDGIHFGIFRVAMLFAGHDLDTCDLPLRVGGMSIVYNKHLGLQGPGGLIPK